MRANARSLHRRSFGYKQASYFRLVIRSRERYFAAALQTKSVAVECPGEESAIDFATGFEGIQGVLSWKSCCSQRFTILHDCLTSRVELDDYVGPVIK